MPPFALLILPLSCISSLGLLMRLTPTTNQGRMIWCWRSSGLLSVVGYDYVWHLIRELRLLIAGKCLVVGIIDITMTNLLVSEDSWELLALDFFKNPFSADTGTLANNIPPPPWWGWWSRESFYFPCTSFFQFYFSFSGSQYYLWHNHQQCFINIL